MEGIASICFCFDSVAEEGVKKLGRLPDGLITQLVEHCTGHCFESQSGLNLFHALISQLLKLCIQL